jgi:hypothetical protein
MTMTMTNDGEKIGDDDEDEEQSRRGKHAT